ncbi:hypothetical protein NC652_009539 [Populus alba x Populus x berolinensis]|nr:hypothetical protein NC652_009539 [Populus alba x Populus x berolinensis]
MSRWSKLGHNSWVNFKILAWRGGTPMRLCCWREDLEKWKLLISGSFTGVEDCDFDEWSWWADDDFTGGCNGCMVALGGASSTCWRKRQRRDCFNWGSGCEIRLVLVQAATGCFGLLWVDSGGRVGKVKETRIMVLVVAGDWSVASGCGYGTVMWYLSWFGGAGRWLWGVGQRRRWGLGCDKRRRNC